ncbi:alpha/beta hydrolase [Paenibacillus beijingensis]|uniref:AB hydrolase-1 domain-containing protein n=1 Tax=Paenibacillus beijingensis TaxID=1126833 RepID=A0A0D5NIH9_9BACL|nr:alpha/beta fold hydrolase [Paenibacillus beijingensis]AJY74718.1 hypothetical protein VN24_09135 [Paenibacillus beijingensis]
MSSSGGTMLWLTGWSMPDAVFDGLRMMLPDFRHLSADLGSATSPEEITARAEQAALAARHAPALGETTVRHAHVLSDAASRIALASDETADSAAPALDKPAALRGPLLIAGWSLGGLLALRLAAQGLADGLVLLAATARFVRPKHETDRGWPDGYVRRMSAALAGDRQAVETQFRSILFTDAECESGLDASLPAAGSWTTPALLAGLDLLRREEQLTRLPEIDCPVLLVHGTDDKVCPFGAAQEMGELLPQAELIAAEGCGHVPFLGREAQTAEAVRRWWHNERRRQHG